MNKCPPCHGDCNQGRNCNAEPAMATMMLEINRLSIELESANAKLNLLKIHAPLTYQAITNQCIGIKNS